MQTTMPFCLQEIQAITHNAHEFERDAGEGLQCIVHV